MAHTTLLPSSVIEAPIPGLKLVHRGKVRDTYAVDKHRLAVYASDRCSIFDFVLGTPIPQKGEVLTALNHFWRTRVLGTIFGHDLVATGSGIDAYVHSTATDRERLQKRISVVRRLKILPIEAVARRMMTTKVYEAYRKTGAIYGHDLPLELRDGDELPFPIFTPTTKARIGHDEPMTVEQVAKLYGVVPERTALQLLAFGQSYASKRGLVVADMKAEMDASGCIGDEVLTPDCARFYDVADWKASRAERRLPTPLDKQFVREWGKGLGIHKRSPKRMTDAVWVAKQVVPSEVVEQTTRLYRYLFWRLTNMKLETYQRETMGIQVRPPIINVEVIASRHSNFHELAEGIGLLHDYKRAGSVDLRVHEISPAYPEALASYVDQLPRDKPTVIIASASETAELPLMLRRLLNAKNRCDVPVLGHIAEHLDPRVVQQLDNVLETLPGKPIVLDHNGRAFFGSKGFVYACSAAVTSEFLPAKPNETEKPRIDIDISF